MAAYPGTPGYRTPAAPKTAPKAAPKAWKAPADWKQKTQARWAANHPQPLFPAVDVSGKERTGLLGDARTQVTKSYGAVPMPSAQSYLQPFADAHARTAASGQNYVNYLDAASANAQNLSGAFNAALTGGMNAGQASVQGQGGSSADVSGIPAAATSLIPAASVGSSFTNYLNAEKPYVGAAVNESQRQISAQQATAAAQYQTAGAQRRQDIQDAIQKLYSSNLDTLQSGKKLAHDAAVTDYLALGKTAYQKAQASERTRYDTGRLTQGQTKLDQNATKINNDAAYKQATLDSKRTAAAAKGIDLAPAYKALLVSTPRGSAKGAAVGPRGQAGGNYTVIENRTDAAGDPAGSTTVTQFVPYGAKVPKSVSFTNPDGTKVTRRVTLKGLVNAKTSSAGSTRKATPASWDRAVSLLKNKYPGQITATWLKQNFPPRPQGS